MLHPRTVGPLVAPLLLLSGCMAPQADRTPREEVLFLIQHGEFAEAVQTAARYTEQDPVSKPYEDLHRYASVAYLLEKGRRATFDDQDRFALQHFQEALALDPDHGAAQRWLGKTQKKLATRLTNEGLEFMANEEFQQAWRRYSEALSVLPGFPLATQALAALDEQLARRENKASQYYDQGVAAMVEAEYTIAANRFGYVRKYRDEDDRLRRRSQKVDKALSAERTAWAKKLEEEQLYFAARSEYQAALRENPDNAEAREGSVRAGREAEVSELLNRGQGALTRAEFQKAENFFEEAQELTLQQQEATVLKLEQLESARRQAQFDAAVNLENDLRFEEAIQAYESLLLQYPKFEEAQNRQAKLRTRVQKALELYGGLNAAKSDAERLTVLMQVEELFPDFRDVPERIARLEAAGVRPLTSEGPAKDGETVE